MFLELYFSSVAKKDIESSVTMIDNGILSARLAFLFCSSVDACHLTSSGVLRGSQIRDNRHHDMSDSGHLLPKFMPISFSAVCLVLEFFRT